MLRIFIMSYKTHFTLYQPSLFRINMLKLKYIKVDLFCLLWKEEDKHQVISSGSYDLLSWNQHVMHKLRNYLNPFCSRAVGHSAAVLFENTRGRCELHVTVIGQRNPNTRLRNQSESTEVVYACSFFFWMRDYLNV